MKSSLVLLSILLTGCTSMKTEDIDRRIDRILDESAAERVGISFYDFRDGTVWEHNADELFHAASTMKVPVMMGIFRAAEQGELSLDQMIPVHNEFISIYDGSTFASGADEDSDIELYDHIGSTMSVEELTRRMIVRSSNLATNILIQRIGAERVTSMIREAGGHRMEVLRGVQDLAAYEAGMNNTATAHDLMVVLRKIAESAEAQSDGPADRMVRILEAQEFNEGIPAGLPEGTRVAHKTGSITEIYHDAAIVYPEGERPWILVVLTGGTSDAEASKTVREIATAFHQWRKR
ncbi:MAG: class A beta-lactamase-related serine hydrolase [Acidobacteria bacterium]|nr:class A beta-lactamase-related serine hydrolase [Acidobacteriota bacterium]